MRRCRCVLHDYFLNFASLTLSLSLSLSLQVELAIANERAESFRALAAAKDEIINAAQAQTKEWRKHAGEVLATSAKAAAASVSKSSSSSSEKGGSSSSKLKK